MNNNIYSFTYKFLDNIGFPETLSLYLSLIINILLLLIIAYVLDYIFKKIFVISLAIIATRTQSTFDDFLVHNKVAKYTAHLIPLYYIYETAPIILKKFIYWENIFEKGVKIYIIILTLWIVRSILNAIKDYLKQQPKFSDKPIDSYVQVVMILLWVYGVLSFFLIIYDVNKLVLLTAIGSVSAGIILVFRDTLLGFIASITVSVNDIVRIGDWITMDKYGADGHVVEINLATVMVKNFDNTTTTIPTYSLISDSFKNWRGMFLSEGRRIKKRILIHPKSLRFVGETEKFSLPNTNSIILEKLKNQTFTTNTEAFRYFLIENLKTNQALNQQMPIMVRYLQITEHGIPLEIHCFTIYKDWENYEPISSKILEFVIASAPYFDLDMSGK